MKAPKSLRSLVTDLYAQRLTLVLLLLSAGALALLEAFGPAFGLDWLQKLLEAIVLVVMGAALVSVLWEVHLRRVFMDEIIEAVSERLRLVSDTSAEGLIGVTRDFTDGIPWAEYVTRAQSIDLYAWAGRGWLQHNIEHLKRAAARKKFICRMVMPDMSNAALLDQMARDSGRPADTLMAASAEAVEIAREIFGDKVKLYWSARVPRYPYYRVGGIAIVGNYANWNGLMAGRPNFVFKSTSPTGRQVAAEFEAVLSAPDTIRVTDAEELSR